MLSASRLLAALVLASVLVPFVSSGADAQGGCDPTADPWCSVTGAAPAAAGRSVGGGSGGGGCTWLGQSFPCTDHYYGSYLGNGCYWQALVPQPLAPPPGGQDPTQGVWGVQTCYTAPGSGVVTQLYQWRKKPAAAPDPAQIARLALAKIHLLGATLGIAPRPGGSGAVGLPVWLSTAVTAGTWGPQSASDTEGGVTVTITARASRIVWSMGDGGQVSCANPGTPYAPQYGMATSPTCGYVYARPSSTAANPTGRYTITATTYWTATWVGGGQTGVLTPTSRAQTSVAIGEVQVVGQ